MDLYERIIFLLVGGAVGFVLGYIVARLRSIEQKMDTIQTEVHEVDIIVKHERDEEGAMRIPRAKSVALFVVLLVVASAAFMTGSVNAKLNRTVACTTQYNTDQGLALSSRDQAIKDGTQSEIDLWTLYEKLYKIATEDPKQIPSVQTKLNKAIIQHRDNLLKVQKARTRNPYPEPNFILNCKEIQDE